MNSFAKSVLISIVIALCIFSSSYAQQVYVKYRGPVETNNGHFVTYDLKPSSLVQEIHYDEPNNYLLVSLKGTHYHYCGIPKGVVSNWVNASSLGRFYGSYVKGNYDCRIYPVPEYKK